MILWPYKFMLVLSACERHVYNAPAEWGAMSELMHPRPVEVGRWLRTFKAELLLPERMTRREVRLNCGTFVALYMPGNMMPTDKHVRMVEKWIAESTKGNA
jgi:hypothetical protein